MPSSDAYPAIHAPLTLAGRPLKNRIVHASMTTRMQKNGRVTEPLIRYYENRARGGAAMVVSEPLAMLGRQAGDPKVQVRDPEAAAGLARWAAALEAHGALLLAQLQHPGRGRHHPGRTVDAISASALPDALSWTMPHALDASEIAALVAEFAESARRLADLGFAGVEISAGHGHLFHQFLSPASNRRLDAYGGDTERRTRLVRDLVRALKGACGPGFVVGVKLPAEDGVRGGVDGHEAGEIARLVAGTGDVDYVAFVRGAHDRSLEDHLPDRHGPPIPWRAMLAALRPACAGVPLMALGRITDPAEAEGLLAGGEAELVGLGRPLLADPAWLEKARAGRSDEIRYCLSCNSCWGYGTTFGRSLSCVTNPRVARPDEVWFVPPAAERARRIVVVGTGPAGMEAACVAAARGHAVTVLGRGNRIGGRLALAAELPGGESLSSVPDWQASAAARHGVDIRLGVDADVETVAALAPDAVVLATGAEMTSPDWLPPDYAAEGIVPDLGAAMASLHGRRARQGGTAVVYDMDHGEAVYAAVERLAALFDRVVVVTPREAIAMDLFLVARQGVLRRLSRLGVEVVMLVEPVWTDAFETEGRLALEHVYTGARTEIPDVVFLAYATPRRPADGLAAALAARGIPLHRVGDARSPQDLMFATATGHEAGLVV
ncbi:FAD-dependent oxidoreductase [Salinarimonas rosea]|uniref:oxidoreductase n=1 Tax=Salinarimonas rosea TaxID=552063 RepID=UPI0003F52451|nr:FAD-dependent oxidoreductase [Salinarimonas rosea]